MYEDRPEKDTPVAVLDELAEYGGLSPNGQAIWRVVLAQNCRIHCFGAMNISPEGFRHTQLRDDVTMQDDGVGVRETRLIEPSRIEVGEHWIPRFRSKGWILQRWFPASVWGTKANWEGEKARDGRSRLLAAFPSRGDYMMMAGPWQSIEHAGDLKAAIRQYNLQQRRNPINWGNHIQAMAVFEEQERQLAADAYAEEMAAQHALGLGSILRSVSSSAQSFRNVVAKHTAGGTHLGSSEKWG